MSIVVAAAAVLVLAADTGSAAAPGVAGRLALELRGGLAAGEVTAARSGPQWKPEAAWHGGAVLDVIHGVAVYAGYGQSSFGCADGFCRSSPVSFSSRGVEAGLQFSAADGWARVGVIHNTLHTRRDTPEETRRHAADGSAGFAAGAGFTFPARWVDLAPGVRYSLHRGAVPGTDADDAVAFFTLDLAVRFRPFARSVSAAAAAPRR
jgi:hypothetical protein